MRCSSLLIILWPFVEHCLFYWGTQNQTQHSRHDNSTEQRGRINSLDLLGMLFWMQLKIPSLYYITITITLLLLLLDIIIIIAICEGKSNDSAQSPEQCKMSLSHRSCCVEQNGKKKWNHVALDYSKENIFNIYSCLSKEYVICAKS